MSTASQRIYDKSQQMYNAQDMHMRNSEEEEPHYDSDPDDASSTEEHYRLELNNLSISRRLRLRYVIGSKGTMHNPTWTVTAFVGNETYGVYGVGSGSTKAKAKEEASKVALMSLRNDGRDRQKKKNKKRDDRALPDLEKLILHDRAQLEAVGRSSAKNGPIMDDSSLGTGGSEVQDKQCVTIALAD
ncbi:hypothetical protein H2248_010529 [Termitomyces sp. 'cryptogamus']|nr:hypothetical protein H2248_010529 [Termitomyces sp. 'cryptogamus']